MCHVASSSKNYKCKHAAKYNTIQYTIQYNNIQYSTIQDNTRQYNAIQYNTTQHNTVQCNTIEYNTRQYKTRQYNTIQHNTIQYNATQYITIQRAFITRLNKTQSYSKYALQRNNYSCMVLRKQKGFQFSFKSVYCRTFLKSKPKLSQNHRNNSVQNQSSTG